MAADIGKIQDDLLTALGKRAASKDVLVQSETDANGGQVAYYPVDSLVESARRISDLENAVQARQSNYGRKYLCRRRGY